jgi:peptide-methionine (S)-S-oxide reductase
VIRTRVGYAGGRKDAPTYHSMGDHTETVQVDYDPERITYRQMLDIFWKSHKPTSGRWSRQYMNAVFYHNEEQRRLVMASKAEVAQKTGRPVKSEVAPLRSFTMAEDYHQKYILKSRNVLEREISRIYPNHLDLVNSTAASRLNGYAGGNGSRDQLTREIESLGLSIEGKKVIFEMVRK